MAEDKPLVLCVSSNLGLKLGRECPTRVLSPRLADPKIRKQTNYYKFILTGIPHFV